MPAICFYREGRYLLANEFPASAILEDAEWAFKGALERHPVHAPSHAGLAEIALLKAFCTYDIAPGKLVEEAEMSARAALDIDPRLASAHIVLGAAACCRWNWSAAAAFDSAKQQAPDEVLSDPWYAAYLLATAVDGRYNAPVAHWEFLEQYPQAREPLRMMRLRMWEMKGNTFARAVSEVFFYATRHGTPDISQSTTSKKDWLMLGVFNCARMSEDGQRFRDAPSEDDEPHAQSLAKFLEGNRFIREIWPGLAPVFAATMGFHQIAQDMLDLLLKKAGNGYVRHSQLALAYMAARKNKEAVAELELACREHDPVMAWLHLWPMLDPLRKERKFKTLVKRMKLPESAGA
jgi:hypothetical protein